MLNLLFVQLLSWRQVEVVDDICDICDSVGAGCLSNMQILGLVFGNLIIVFNVLERLIVFLFV